MISAGCASSRADSPPPAPTAPPAKAAPAVTVAPAPPEAALGVADRGIWSDLDGQLQVALPAGLTPARVSAHVDADRGVLVLAIDDFPRKVYPLGGPAALQVGAQTLALRPGDRAELAPLLTAARLTAAPITDRDTDGVPDALDVLLGAKKTVLNADAYTEGYKHVTYPNGDVPREMGVCTDVVIRAVRNAGLDLQSALQHDIRRAPKAYPMIRTRGNPSIDHRRVKTLLPYFKRQWIAHTAALDDAADPLRPGDIVFMDTFPSRPGPDHIGVISDTVGESGMPLVINNWTVGTVTAEMDLLGSIPVTHRFRIPPRR